MCFSNCVKCFIISRTEETLGELLKEIQQHPNTVRFDAMANIIAVHCQSEGKVMCITQCVGKRVATSVKLRSIRWGGFLKGCVRKV